MTNLPGSNDEKEEKQLAESERLAREAEEAKQTAKEEADRKAEEKRKAKAERLAKEARKRLAAEEKRIEEERLAEEKRLEEERLAKEAEEAEKRLEDERLAKEAEEKRLEEEERKAKEARKRLAERRIKALTSLKFLLFLVSSVCIVLLGSYLLTPVNIVLAESKEDHAIFRKYVLPSIEEEFQVYPIYFEVKQKNLSAISWWLQFFKLFGSYVRISIIHFGDIHRNPFAKHSEQPYYDLMFDYSALPFDIYLYSGTCDTFQRFVASITNCAFDTDTAFNQFAQEIGSDIPFKQVQFFNLKLDSKFMLTNFKNPAYNQMNLVLLMAIFAPLCILLALKVDIKSLVFMLLIVVVTGLLLLSLTSLVRSVDLPDPVIQSTAPYTVQTTKLPDALINIVVVLSKSVPSKALGDWLPKYQQHLLETYKVPANFYYFSILVEDESPVQQYFDSQVEKIPTVLVTQSKLRDFSVALEKAVNGIYRSDDELPLIDFVATIGSNGVSKKKFKGKELAFPHFSESDVSFHLKSIQEDITRQLQDTVKNRITTAVYPPVKRELLKTWNSFPGVPKCLQDFRFAFIGLEGAGKSTTLRFLSQIAGEDPRIFESAAGTTSFTQKLQTAKIAGTWLTDIKGFPNYQEDHLFIIDKLVYGRLTHGDMINYKSPAEIIDREPNANDRIHAFAFVVPYTTDDNEVKKLKTFLASLRKLVHPLVVITHLSLSQNHPSTKEFVSAIGAGDYIVLNAQYPFDTIALNPKQLLELVRSLHAAAIKSSKCWEDLLIDYEIGNPKISLPNFITIIIIFIVIVLTSVICCTKK